MVGLGRGPRVRRVTADAADAADHAVAELIKVGCAVLDAALGRSDTFPPGTWRSRGTWCSRGIWRADRGSVALTEPLRSLPHVSHLLAPDDLAATVAAHARRLGVRETVIY